MSDNWGEPVTSPMPGSAATSDPRADPAAEPRPRAKIRIGSRVVGPKGGEQIGTVERVVISPNTRQVTHLLVHRGDLPFLHNDVMVPVEAVSAVNEDTVQLSVLVEMLNRMPAHDAANYVRAGATWEPPGEYRRDQVLLALPRAGEGLDRLQPLSQGRTESTEAAPEGVVIGGKTRVEAADGPIGTIDRVLLDPDTGRVTHFVVRKGRFLPRHVIVPVDWAAEMTPDVVRLAAGREQLAALPEYRPDDEIAEKVLEAFRSYPPLRRVIHGIGRYEAPLSPYEEDTVRVLVQDGVVTLEGNVETSAYKSMAALLAREVPGVREVRNLLVSDDQLEPAVVSALLTDPRTKRAVRARVESDLGVITLTGQALDKKARADAERVAYDVPGVRWVVNRLRVQSG